MTAATRTPGIKHEHTVESTILSNGYWVSTVNLDPVRPLDNLLGAFSSLVPDRADLSTPGNFETMVFACRPDGEVEHWQELDFARYTTVEEAREGHERIVQKWMVKS